MMEKQLNNFTSIFLSLSFSKSLKKLKKQRKINKNLLVFYTKRKIMQKMKAISCVINLIF